MPHCPGSPNRRRTASIDHLGPMLVLQPRKRFAKVTVLIVDGTLVPTRDHNIAERSKNYRFHQPQGCH
ncbi:hypothetical protein Slala05_84820 [Streptomyces lavendulae subsp. lavendulae]|nr:hypothetical protein Slala05_84820 [Streptomyces lavendulae subsp. lavendulae]